MTENDLIYIKSLVEQKKITGPVLELGAGYGGNTCRKVILDAGLTYYASDMHLSPGVDYVVDFESDNIETFFTSAVKFKSILVLNVLEHTFNPVRILDNAKKLLDCGGSLVVITPAIWTLHNYPIDCYRMLPNWYERYAESRKMILERECFEYLGYGGVGSYLDANRDYQFPAPKKSGVAYWRSRIVHRLFNTFGRGMAFPSHLAIGAVISLKGTTDGAKL